MQTVSLPFSPEIWVYLQDQMKVAKESELSKSKNTPQIPF